MVLESTGVQPPLYLDFAACPEWGGVEADLLALLSTDLIREGNSSFLAMFNVSVGFSVDPNSGYILGGFSP